MYTDITLFFSESPKTQKKVPQLCLLFWLGNMLVLLACPPGDIILAQHDCTLNDITFCLHQKYLTCLSINIAWGITFFL
jgi:hypothetical protein